MGAVHVGVGHEHDLVVAGLGEVEVLADAGAHGGDDGLDLDVLERLVQPRLLDVQDLAPDGQDGLEGAVAGLLGRAAGRVALDDEQLRLARVARGAVGQLARQRGRLEQRLAPGQLAGVAGRHAGPGGLDALDHDRLGLGAVLLEPLVQGPVGGLLDEPLDVGVAELGLGLALELGLAQLHRDDRGQALADVVPAQVGVLLLEQGAGPRVAVDRRGQGGPEAFLVGPALVGVDGVGEGRDGVVVARVPLHGDLRVMGVRLALEVDDLGVDRLLGGVDVGHEVADAPGVLVDLGLALVPLVGEGDAQAGVEEGHLAHAVGQGLEAELGLLEDVRVGPERDR